MSELAAEAMEALSSLWRAAAPPLTDGVVAAAFGGGRRAAMEGGGLTAEAGAPVLGPRSTIRWTRPLSAACFSSSIALRWVHGGWVVS
jgi:hypothetical protein